LDGLQGVEHISDNAILFEKDQAEHDIATQKKYVWATPWEKYHPY